MTVSGNKKEKRICGIVTLLILIVCGVIFLNSQYFGGYKAALYNVDSGVITEVAGYDQNGASFNVNGNGEGYIKLIQPAATVGEILVSFENLPDNDIDVNINYNDGAQDKVISWKSGSRYFKIPTGIENSGITVKIPCDFVLDNICYADKNNEQASAKKMTVITFIMVIVIWFILMLSEHYRLFYAGIVRKIKQAVNSFKNKDDSYKRNLNSCIRVVCIVLGTVILSVIVVKVAAILGKCSFNWKMVTLAVCVLSLADMFLFARKAMAKKIEVAGFVVVLVIGIMFSFLEPASPGVSWDDETHYSRAVNLSHKFDKKISASDQVLLNKFASVALDKAFYAKRDQKAYMEYLNMLEKSKYYIDAPGISLDLVSVSYIPSAVGLMVGRGIGLPFSLAYILGKFANTLLFAILVYFSMKKLKDGKIVILLIALIPTNMYLAANYSYDTWLTGWAMLGLSTFFGELQQKEKKLELKTALLVYVSMFLAVLPKMVYFPLIFICFFMPQVKFKSKADYWKYKLGIVMICLLPFIIVYMQNIAVKTDVADTRGGGEVSSTSQLDFIKGNVKTFLLTLVNFLKTYLNPFVEGNEYINQLSYNGYIPLGKSIPVIMIIGACVSRSEKSKKIFPWWFKLGTLAVYAGIGAMAAISMYVMFTPVGSDVINGCQGRYIIPALFPTLYVLSRFGGKTIIKDHIGEANINSILIALLSLAGIYGIWLGCVSLY